MAYSLFWARAAPPISSAGMRQENFIVEFELKRFSNVEIHTASFTRIGKVDSSIDVFFWKNQVTYSGATGWEELAPFEGVFVPIDLSRGHENARSPAL